MDFGKTTARRAGIAALIAGLAVAQGALADHRPATETLSRTIAVGSLNLSSQAGAREAYHRIAADRADAEHYKHVIAGYEHSLSWRLTSPLRLGMLVMRWLEKKVKGALRRR